MGGGFGIGADRCRCDFVRVVQCQEERACDRFDFHPVVRTCRRVNGRLETGWIACSVRRTLFFLFVIGTHRCVGEGLGVSLSVGAGLGLSIGLGLSMGLSVGVGIGMGYTDCTHEFDEIAKAAKKEE